MAQSADQELTDRFEQFYRNYYREEIGELAQRYPNEQRSLYVDWNDLYRFDPDLADDYLAQPDQIHDYAREALRLYDLPVDVSLGQAHVRVSSLPEVTEIRGIRAHDVNTFVSVQGIVRKATDVRPKIEEAAFECQRCGTLTYIPQSGGSFQEPHECQGCERQGPFKINYDQSTFVDAQKLRVQESPEGLRGGETPQSIDVTIEDDITGRATPGDHVTVTGVLRIEQQESGGQKSRLFDVHMDGHALKVEDEEFEEMDIDDEDVQEILELAKSDDIYQLMVDSIAPTIYGFDTTKLAITLQLFSGVTKHLPDESRIRGDMHILLIGDPGTGKCVSGDTNVTLADGSEIEIRDLVESHLTDPTPIDDGVYQEIDIPVPSLDVDGSISHKRATKVWKREAPETMYRIRTSGGNQIEVTPSHPLFVPDDGEIRPVKAEELVDGDVIAASETVPTEPAVDSEAHLISDGGLTVQTEQIGPNQTASSTAHKVNRPGVVDQSKREVSWEEITSIDEVTPDYDWVYDLEVAGTHNYLTNNILSHNSQILQYIRHISPRSIYTSGKGSSSAGLTAAAVRDDFGDGQQWSLEAGALVLADKGVAAVDELDKMDSGDRSALHEALEQQSYHPNSEILLADGRRIQIGELVDEEMKRRSDEIVDGVNCEILPVDDLRVHSVDLESNQVEKRPVDRVSRHEAPDEFVRVMFTNGRSITVTPEHPLFADSGTGLETVEAREISEGTFVPAPRKLPNSTRTVSLQNEPQRGKEKDVTIPDSMSPNLAELLGFLVAEGHSYVGSTHQIGFSNQDPRLLDRMEMLAQTLFEIESYRGQNNAGTTTLTWISTKLYRWFQSNFPELLNTARGKRIPAKVLGASEEEIRRFLIGAFAGDGGVESEAMAFSTSSRGLADDYADALSKIGVASRIHYNSAEDSWKTYVMGDSTEQFVDAVVDPADERYEKARWFVDRSNGVKRHHDVLPHSVATKIRHLRRLAGLPLTGEFRSNLDNEFGVRVETVDRNIQQLRDRLEEVRTAAKKAEGLADIRAAIDWSARQLACQLDGETGSAIHYAENGGYDRSRRRTLYKESKTSVEDALATVEQGVKDLESRLDLRYFRVKDVEVLPNEGDLQTKWVYDVTVEPTNTFISQGVILHNSVSISKAGINATLKSRCALLGAANPKYGRFDQYEPIGEQIDLEPALVSRFDLIFTVTDQPDEEKDAALADHILQTNYAGELGARHKQLASPDVTAEEVAESATDVDPAIDPDLFRKYIAYAKRNVFPSMTDEARSMIKDFYVDLRARGTDEDAPVPITARKLEALVRLAEASARVRLSDTVEAADAERVIDIVRTCLKDIGVDPETGQFDADVIETGTSKSQRDRIKTLRGLIEELEGEYDRGAPVEEVLSRAEDIGMNESQVEHEIEKLRQRGEIYEPAQNHLRTT